MKFKEITKLLLQGKIGVMPTDTIYGMVGSALNPQTVEKIYKLRKRSADKPMIILISSLNNLNQFNIKLTIKQKKFLKEIWPNPVSVVLPCRGKKFEYLHRGTDSLAFRIPKNEMLLKILKRVGPLVAPSANYEGELPSATVEDARRYFGEQVNCYINGGEMKSASSTIIQLNDHGIPRVIRNGAFRL